MGALVSILVPCLNAAAMLPHCLRSCEEQTHRDIEVLFVDNGSTDGSAEVVAAFKKTSRLDVTLAECATPGPNAARNVAFALARGDYVQWLDADDELHPRKLELQVAALEGDRSKDFAWSDWMMATWRNGLLERADYVREHRTDDLLRDLMLGTWRAPVAYLFRRSLADTLKAVGAFAPDIVEGDDREYATTAALVGKGDLFVPGALSSYNRWSAQQITSQLTVQSSAAAYDRIFSGLRSRAHLAARELTDDHRFLLAQQSHVCGLANFRLSRWSDAAEVFSAFAEPRTVALAPSESEVLSTLAAMGQRGQRNHIENWSRMVERVRVGARRGSVSVRRAVYSLHAKGLLA